VTEKNFFNYVEAHPVAKRIKSICPIRLLPLDDLIGEPWQYGISLAYALFRGFAELGLAMTETYILFLNADFVLADGSYERLIPHMRRGERVLLAPSYCTVARRAAPLLMARRDLRTRALVISSPEMARMILQYRHNTIRAKTINQDRIHFEYMDQAYWEVDEDTLLARQMPISLVAMRPEIVLDDINTFWDWGIVYEFCPSRQVTVIGDSNEFLMLELRDEDTHLDLIRLGPTTPKSAASRMTGYITQYQTDAGRFPLTLHAGELPAGSTEAHAALQSFIDELISYLPSTPIDHRNHEQWRYHKEHLRRYHEEKARTAVNSSSSADNLMTDAAAAPHPIPRPRDAKVGGVRKFLLGKTADTRPWHPLHLVYRDILPSLDDLAARMRPNGLLVGSANGAIGRYIALLPGSHFWISPESLLGGNLDERSDAGLVFDLCILDLSRADLSHARQLHEAATRRLRKGGKLWICWINFAGESGAELERDLVRCLALPGQYLRMSLISSGAARLAIGLAHWASALARIRYRALRDGALLAAAGCALFASLTRRSAPGQRGISSNCIGMIIEMCPEPEPEGQLNRSVEGGCGNAIVVAGAALD